VAAEIATCLIEGFGRLIRLILDMEDKNRW